MLAHIKIGEGPAVIFIHGYPFRKEMWSKQTAPVANEGFTAIAVDLRGHGESQGVPETLSGMGDDIIELMDSLKIEKAVIGGMSMGGYITYDLMARYPERFLGAFLIATTARGDTPEKKETRNQLIKEIEVKGSQAVLDAYLSKLFGEKTYTQNPVIVLKVKEWTISAKKETLIGAMKAMRDREDRTAILSEIKFPTLFIAGKEDKLIPVERMEEESSLVQDSELHVIENAGHMVNMEEPKIVAETLIGWLKEKFA